MGVGGMERGTSLSTVGVKVGSGVRVGGILACSEDERNGKAEQARVIKIKMTLRSVQGRMG